MHLHLFSEDRNFQAEEREEGRWALEKIGIKRLEAAVDMDLTDAVVEKLDIGAAVD